MVDFLLGSCGCLREVCLMEALCKWQWDVWLVLYSVLVSFSNLFLSADVLSSFAAATKEMSESRVRHASRCSGCACTRPSCSLSAAHQLFSSQVSVPVFFFYFEFILLCLRQTMSGGGYYVLTMSRCSVPTSAFFIHFEQILNGFRWNLEEVITTANRWT